MATELPKSLEDEFRRLAALPGDDDVILPDDEETTAPDLSVQEPAATAAPQPAPTKPTPKKPVNLDDFDEFRKYKSERDRKEAELQQRLADHERQLAAQRQADEAARMDLSMSAWQTRWMTTSAPPD